MSISHVCGQIPESINMYLMYIRPMAAQKTDQMKFIGTKIECLVFPNMECIFHSTGQLRDHADDTRKP